MKPVECRTLTLTEQERHDIERANERGRQPVLLVHGLWLLSSSWDPWRTLIEENGFVAVAPAGPTIRRRSRKDGKTRTCSRTR
jgi:hypothetical protein